MKHKIHIVSHGAIVSAAFLAAAGTSFAQTINLKCELARQSGGTRSFFVVVDAANKTIVDDGKLFTIAGGPPIRNHEGWDGVEKIKSWSDSSVVWGTEWHVNGKYAGGDAAERELNRLTGEMSFRYFGGADYSNRYAQGKCVKVDKAERIF